MPKFLTNASTFFGGVRNELKQVSWPSRSEVIGSALVVFVGVAILAAFISVCDVVLSRLVQMFLQSW